MDLSSWMAIRIFFVISRSVEFIFCWSAVGVAFLFVLVLSGADCCVSWLTVLPDARADGETETTNNAQARKLILSMLISLSLLDRVSSDYFSIEFIA